jgi:hypothetical protein
MFASVRGLPRLGPLLRVGRARRGPLACSRTLRAKGPSRAGRTEEIGFPFSSELGIGFII